MQRTVKMNKILYVDVTEKGELAQHEETINERDVKKAVKLLIKNIGHPVTVISVEPLEKTYYIDDEIFFKFAKIMENEEN